MPPPTDAPPPRCCVWRWRQGSTLAFGGQISSFVFCTNRVAPSKHRHRYLGAVVQAPISKPHCRTVNSSLLLSTRLSCCGQDSIRQASGSYCESKQFWHWWFSYFWNTQLLSAVKPFVRNHAHLWEAFVWAQRGEWLDSTRNTGTEQHSLPKYNNSKSRVVSRAE